MAFLALRQFKFLNMFYKAVFPITFFNLGLCSSFHCLLQHFYSLKKQNSFPKLRLLISSVLSEKSFRPTSVYSNSLVGN